MKIDFSGRKAIVCGGSRGIGRAIALGFAQAGGDVSICARDPKALEETRSEIAALGRNAHAASADLAKGDPAARIRDDALSRARFELRWECVHHEHQQRQCRVGILRYGHGRECDDHEQQGSRLRRFEHGGQCDDHQ